MILDSTIRLESAMAADASTNSLDCVIKYQDWLSDVQVSRPGFTRIAIATAADTTILSAPTDTSKIREILELTVHNDDTITHTVTIKTDVTAGGTDFAFVKKQIAVGETLAYNKTMGWYIL